MPLQRRLPKRGFRNFFRQAYATVNLKELGRFPAGSVVDEAAMREHGLVPRRLPIKVLGTGDVDRALTVRAHAFSARAKERIVAAGGTAEELRDA
jgi:large subunit ribosomal protein L15